jgi:hypothetical protein
VLALQLLAWEPLRLALRPRLSPLLRYPLVVREQVQPRQALLLAPARPALYWQVLRQR